MIHFFHRSLLGSRVRGNDEGVTGLLRLFGEGRNPENVSNASNHEHRPTPV